MSQEKLSDLESGAPMPAEDDQAPAATGPDESGPDEIDLERERAEGEDDA